MCDNLVRSLGDPALIAALFKVCVLLIFWVCVGSQGGDGYAARQMQLVCLLESDFPYSYELRLSDVGKFNAITRYGFSLLGLL